MEDLNSESLIDLEDGRVIAPAGSPEALAENALVVIGQTADDKEAQKAAEELEGYSVTLQTTVDGLTRQHEMEDVVNTLMASETISRTDAVQLVKCFEGLTDVVGQPETFTAVPSRTNLEPTKRYVRKAVYDEETALNEQLQQFIDVALEPVQQQLLMLEERHLPTCLEGLEMLHHQAEDLFEELEEGKLFLLYNANKELIDTRLMAFVSLFNQMFTVENSEYFAEVVRGLVRALSDPSVKLLLKSASNPRVSMPPSEFTSPEYEVENLSLMKYLPYFTHKLIANYLTHQTVMLQERCQALHDDKTRVVEKTRDQRRALAIEAQNLCRDATNLYRLVLPVKTLVYWTKHTFDLFEKLADSSR